MDIHTLLPLLGLHLGIQNLMLDDGVCCIAFNDGHEIFIEPAGGNEYIHVYAVIGGMPSYGREEVYESIFERNLFGNKTNTANICCDSERQEIVLQKIIAIKNIMLSDFVDDIDRFADTLLLQKTWLMNFRSLEKGTFTPLVSEHHLIRI